MKDNSRVYSLLPYLNAESGSPCLRLPLISDDDSVLEKTAFPFPLITDSDPLTRMVEAQFITDAGAIIENVFLLIQRDRYLLAKDELWPVSNRDIEDAWQKAFSFYASDSSFIPLASQLDESGNLTPLSPLFFCKRRERFFHPPCPKCGEPLEQCRDDDMLSASGLLASSVSLRRYLYCRPCATTGKLDFYAYETAPTDPPALRDRGALIRKFKLLVEGSRESAGLPCIGCPDIKECYGTDQRAASRIVPFSFYPFRMFIFKAMSLNALDFIQLLSGASFPELEAGLVEKGETGRIGCLKRVRQSGPDRPPALFSSDERYFLETLYLKLSFLGEVFQSLSQGRGLISHPDLRPSIDRIWVRLPDNGGLLPYLWNFSVRVIDIFRQPSGRNSVDPNTLSFIGLVWFYTLLVNRRQDISEVQPALTELTEKSLSEENFAFGSYLKKGLYPAFLPNNIFHDPAGNSVDDKWHPLWEKALELGWSLFNAGAHPVGNEFSEEDFRGRLEEIRGEVRQSLFIEAPDSLRQTVPPEDKAIHAILKSVYDKWSSRAAEEEELTETIVISREGTEEKSGPPSPVSDESEGAPETLIIPTGERGDSSKPQSAKPEEREEVPPETVIISALGAEDFAGPSTKAEPEKGGDIPPETVIMSVRDIGGSSGPSAMAEPKAPGQIEQPEAGEAKAKEEKKKKFGDEDFLAETIILKPSDLQDRNKDGKK